MQIVTFHNQPIKAVVRLPYRGYEISLTTLPSNPCLDIFDPAGDMVTSFSTSAPDVMGIADAKGHIDWLLSE
jgi:hypothetical protein